MGVNLTYDFVSFCLSFVATKYDLTKNSSVLSCYVLRITSHSQLPDKRNH